MLCTAHTGTSTKLDHISYKMHKGLSIPAFLVLDKIIVTMHCQD